jgi:hypothetical protein
MFALGRGLPKALCELHSGETTERTPPPGGATHGVLNPHDKFATFLLQSQLCTE